MEDLRANTNMVLIWMHLHEKRCDIFDERRRWDFFFTIKQRTKGGRVILNLSTTVYLEWDVENPCFFSHKSWWFVLTKGSRMNVNFRNSLRWPIYVINSVDNTELPCYTLPPTQHHSFFRNQPPSIHYKWSTNLEDKEAGAWFVIRGLDCG